MSCLIPLILEVVLRTVVAGSPGVLSPQLAAAPLAKAARAKPSAESAARTWQCDFQFHDDTLLRPGQQLGGRVWLRPASAAAAPSDRRALPALVVLHGLNADGHPHRLMRAGGFDSRTLVQKLVSQHRIPPLIVAAPSQTVKARSSRTLWVKFDLDGFLHAVESCLPRGVTVDRSRLIVAGFSGAGCNPEGGLLHIAAHSTVKPSLLAAVDTCMDQDLGQVLAHRLEGGPEFLAIWQAGWRRDTQAYLKALGFRSCRDGDDDDSCSDPRAGLDWVRSVRRSGSRVFAEVSPDPRNEHSDHVDVMARFLEFALPQRFGPPWSAPGGGARVH